MLGDCNICDSLLDDGRRLVVRLCDIRPVAYSAGSPAGCDGVDALWPILMTRKEQSEAMNELRKNGGAKNGIRVERESSGRECVRVKLVVRP